MAQRSPSPSRVGGESTTAGDVNSPIQSAVAKTSSPSRQEESRQMASNPVEMVEIRSSPSQSQPLADTQPQAQDHSQQPPTLNSTSGYQIDTHIPSSSITPIVASAPTFEDPPARTDGSTTGDAKIETATAIPHTLTNSIHINLLNPVTDTRHPYTIDESYLKRRDVKVTDGNPINMTVYTLKELIWRDWRHDWEAKPSTPTLIRLIYMGRLLDDKQTLKDSRFSNSNNAHVVHMTIKPQDIVDEEDGKVAKSHRSTHGDVDPSPRCRCVIL